jgi:mannose-6-phosphate isomerase-like protein (cupin superfamily)
VQPGERLDMPDEGANLEQGYLVLGGQAELVAQGERLAAANSSAPAFIIGPPGLGHQLHNIGTEPVRFLHVSVTATTPAVDHRIYLGYFAAKQLKWRDAIHGGSGRIATRHVLRPEDFHSTWTFLDQAVLSAGGSVGYHYHDALEECFVVTKGRGYMTIDDETFAVGPGSITWQGIGKGHGIYNPGPDELDFLRVAVAQPNEEYTTIDLHDDLAGRAPNAD